MAPLYRDEGTMDACICKAELHRSSPETTTALSAVKVKVAQLCLTLCDSMNYSVHGILQARILEWEPFPSPGNLPNPGIEPRSLTLQTDSYQLSHKGRPDKGKDDDKNKPRGAGWMGKETQLIDLLTLRAKLKRLELEDWNTGKNARLVIYTWELLLK